MRTYTYHNEFKILISSVLNAINEIVIKRINEVSGQSEDNIQTNVKYAPKSRILQDIVNKNNHIQLPVMALWNGGFSIDTGRTFNKIDGFYAPLSGNVGEYGHYPQPLPIKLNLPLSIISRYQNDTDQILTCLLSNFYPYIVISYRHPDNGLEVRCKVIWNGQVSTKIPIDINPQTPYRIESDMVFTVEGWIFKNAYNPTGIIWNIDTKFTSVSSLADNYEYMSQFEDVPLKTDTLFISGRPFIRSVTPYSVTNNLSSYTIDLIGNMFNYVTGLAISAEDSVYPLSSYTLIDYFSASQLSSQYTPFSGILIENYTINSNTHLTFTLPMPISTGKINILAWNDAGRGNLISDSYFEGNLYYQPPYTSGINVT